MTSNANDIDQVAVLTSKNDKCDARSSSLLLKFVYRWLWSIQFLVIIVLLTAVIVVAAVIWSVNVALASSAVQSVASQARKSEIDNILQHIRTHFAEKRPVQIMHDTLVLEMRRGDERATNPSRLLEYFSATLPHSKLISMIFMSFQQITGMRRIDNRYFSINGTVGPGAIFQVHEFDIFNQTVGEWVISRYNLSFVDRPYYINAMRKGGPAWSPPVESRIAPPYPLSIPYTIPLYNSTTKEILGIVFGSLDFGAIGRLLRSTVELRNTRVFIIDAAGLLVGSSIGENFVVVNSAQVQMSPRNHSDHVIRRTDEEILKRYGRYSSIPMNVYVQFSYGFSKNKRRITMHSITDEDGLLLYAISAQKEGDIMAPVYKANMISAIVCSTVILMTLIISLIAGCVITRPLKSFSRRLREMSRMNTEYEAPHRAALYEVDEVNQSMQRMQLGVQNFEKYVPREVVLYLMKSNSRVVLGVVPRYISTMFTDLKDFTTMAESIHPNTLVTLMEEFFLSMSSIIYKHSGVVDKYIGDAIMAIWNAPTPVVGHEYEAVVSALEMTKQLDALNESWKLKNFPCLEMRIGIHTANCLVGNLGCEYRVNYSAIGDGVNIAARLEQLNKRYGTTIMIGESTYNAVRDKVVCKWISALNLKGKKVQMNVYQVVCLADAANSQILDGVGLHTKLKSFIDSENYEEAAKLTKVILSDSPDNVSIQELQDRLLASPGLLSPLIL